MRPLDFARGQRLRRWAATAIAVALASIPLAALGTKVVQVKAASAVVRAEVALDGVFKSAHKELVDEGGTLYVRVEAELWEDRTVWDRLVAPARVTILRVRRDRSSRGLVVTDSAGANTPYNDYPDPINVSLDVAPADRVEESARYYLHALTTVGARLERGSDEVGDVVFGRDEDASGLAAIGKFVFKTAQQINEYMQNVTAEVTSRRMTGKQILGK